MNRFTLVVITAIIVSCCRNYSYAHSVALCSREVSRKVRTYIRTQIYPKLTHIAPHDLPVSCPIHPHNDIYLDQENNKTMVTRGEWKCQYCKKRFKSELYLDKHMDNKHVDKLSNETTTCLADLCPIFGCHSVNTVRKKGVDHLEDKLHKMKAQSFGSVEICTPKDVERHQYKCEVLLRKCFGDDSSDSNYKLFDSHVCGKIGCKRGELMGSLSDDKSDSGFLMWLLQVVIVVVLLVGVFFYSLSADIRYNSVAKMMGLGRARGHPKSAVSSMKIPQSSRLSIFQNMSKADKKM